MCIHQSWWCALDHPHAAPTLPPGEHLAKMQQLDDKLAALAEELQAQTGRRQQSVRAAFVTFNSENERITCTSQCPASEMGDVFWPALEAL